MSGEFCFAGSDGVEGWLHVPVRGGEEVDDELIKIVKQRVAKKDRPNMWMTPALAEPWFLTFGAEVEFRVVMLPDDLKKAGLDELGKKWG